MLGLKGLGRLLRAARSRLRPTPAGQGQLRMRYEYGGVPVVLEPLPEPFRIVGYSAGMLESWAAFLSRTGEFGSIPPSNIESEVLHSMVPDGAAFVLVDNEIVGAAAACVIPSHAPWSTLMYVMVAPEHRGKGIGGAVVKVALSAAHRAGFPGMILHTDDHRLPAIRSYLRLGFVPDEMSDAQMKSRWEQVLRRISAHHVS
jgi:GNAT superfamily N-acetyltransferase